MDLFYDIKPFEPYKHMSEKIKAPGSGFYGTVTIVKTVDISSGDHAAFSVTLKERNCMVLETLGFKAYDEQGPIKVVSCAVTGDTITAFLARNVVGNAKVRIEWKYMPHYNY